MVVLIAGPTVGDDVTVPVVERLHAVFVHGNDPVDALSERGMGNCGDDCGGTTKALVGGQGREFHAAD